MATGEDVPNGHSLQARCVILSIKKGATDTDTLTALQELAEEEVLAQLMSNFLSWVARKADAKQVNDLMKLAHSDCMIKLPTSGHTRMRDNLASLMSGIWLLLEFGKELCDFSEGDITRLKSATLNAANKVAELQITADKEASDADRFIELLRSSLIMGAAHLANERGGRPKDFCNWGWKVTGADKYEKVEGQGTKIGWTFNESICLDMKAALSVIKPLSTRLGNHLGSSERAINKALFEAGMLAKYDEGRYKRKVSVEGQRIPVICLAVNCVMDKEETKLEPVDEDKPQKYESPF